MYFLLALVLCTWKPADTLFPVLQVLAALYVLRQVQGWFSRLNADSKGKIVQTMEDPTALQPVWNP
jgi:hypothetical protein